jgi:hypothetical protein
MLVNDSELNLDGNYKDLEDQIIVSMTSKMHNKDVW